MNPLDRPWLLHPAAVHFPIALLTLGLFVRALRVLLPPSVYGRRPGVESGLIFSSRWLLWLGTLAAWAALGLGLLAEDTAPHVPLAWQMLNEHKELAFWTVGLFTTLSAVRLWLDRRERPRVVEIAFLVGWLAAAGVLVATAWHGGELAYTFNMGTKASQD